MNRIESLTGAQWDDAFRQREEWRAACLSTEPADRSTAERVISELYRQIGKDAPRFVWLDGPLSCCIAGAILPNIGQLGAQLRSQLWDQLGGQLEDQLGDQLEDQLGGQLGAQLRSQLWDQLGGQLEGQLEDQLEDPWSQLRDQLWGQLWGQLGDQLDGHLAGQLRAQLGGQLRAQLWDQLWGQLGDQLEGQLWDQLEGQLKGQLEGQLQNHIPGQEYGYWVAHYSICGEIVNLKEGREELSLWADLVKSTGWWFPYEGVCLCAERPRTLRFDDRQLLHCEDGPAIECRDGFRVYSWHGTRIPAEWIEQRDSLDPTLALTHEDIEQRRAVAEIIEWHNVLDQLDNRIIDTDRDPQIGELIEVNLPDSGLERFIRVVCGTGRTFAIPVPPECKTAIEGQLATRPWLTETELRNQQVRT